MCSFRSVQFMFCLSKHRDYVFYWRASSSHFLFFVILRKLDRLRRSWLCEIETDDINSLIIFNHRLVNYLYYYMQ